MNRHLAVLLALVSIVSAISCSAQYVDKQTNVNSFDSFTKGTGRGIMILSRIGIKNEEKSQKVHTVLVAYFDSLERVFAERKLTVEKALVESFGNKELADARSEKAWAAAAGKLNKLHATFLGKLSSLLTEGQIEKIKDEMTEGGLRAEFSRFLELLPNLSQQHKSQVMAYLVEAREAAMDAETAGMRKQWFIKYRGRANNFLAAAGYDLRKATQELEKRKSVKEKGH